MSLRRTSEAKASGQWLFSAPWTGWRRDFFLLCEENPEKVFTGSLPPYLGPVDAAWLARFPAETALKLGRPDLALAALQDQPDSIPLAFQLFWIAHSAPAPHRDQAQARLKEIVARMEENAEFDLETPQLAAALAARLHGKKLSLRDIREIQHLLPAEIDRKHLPELSLPPPKASRCFHGCCIEISPSYYEQLRALRQSKKAPQPAPIPELQDGYFDGFFQPSRQEILLLQLVIRPELIAQIDPVTLHKAPRSCGHWPLVSRKSEELSSNEAIYWAVHLGGLKAAKVLTEKTRAWPEAERRLVDLAILCGLEGMPEGWAP
ncbi:MAG: hypothetical protein RL095_1277 [Verrucomicrobiota bacterium]